jgi:diguanylate cyclase (GGDEF)-like protein
MALLGLVALPALAGILLTALLMRGAASPLVPLQGAPGRGTEPAADAIATELLVGLAFLVIVAAIVTLALLRYLLRPLDEAVGSQSQLRVLYRQAHEDSRRDGLTGLGNQRAFHEELRELIEVVEKRGDRLAVVLMDLDDLKIVNDRAGHAAGDEMLDSMAATMREVTRPGDRLYRIGGDEFAMLLPGTDVDAAVTLTEDVLHAARQPRYGARPSPFSAGISAVPQFSRDEELVYRQADAALYWAKRHGRGLVEAFDPERDQLPDNLVDASRLAVQEVILGHLLAPVFQPIVDLRTGLILGFEGLIRPDPTGPLPDTARLFAAAAAAGRTVELDVACIDQVLMGARAIGPDRLLTLNLSPRTLEVRDFDAGWLLQGLYRNGISPGRVIVELTEREEIDDLVRLRRTFEHLRQYGLRIAADDVGAGNSGLRLLSQVQFDIVKLDLSLVQDGVRRMGARAVLQSLRDLALDQGAQVVAEGVETREQLQVLRDLRIGAGQGYLLGRPAISVAATFVDVDHLGELQPVTAAVAPLIVEPGALQAGELARHLRPGIVVGHERPVLVLPGQRLGGLVGPSAGTA